jgi:Protein of Unknown function (DUF2784)
LCALRADNEDVSGWRVFAGIPADIVLMFHAAYVAFVVLGLLAIIVGWALGWRWVRDPWFRGFHLASIGVVFAESLIGIACPLTVFENWLRWRAGEQGYATDFLAYWVSQLIFFNWPPWVFLSLYAGVTTAVAALYLLVPPEPCKPRAGAQASGTHAGGASLP